MRIIENKPKRLIDEVRELIQYRNLIFMLAARELKIKYAQTVLGLFWSVLRPLSYLAIYTFFFTRVVDIQAVYAPYALIALSGMMAWNYFLDIVNSAGNCLITDAQLIKRNYVPKLVLPLYRSILGLVELFISLAIFFVIQIILGHQFSINIVALPLLVLLNMVLGLSVALWTSALSIRSRDFFHFVITFVNFFFWLSPVFYMPELIPLPYRYFMWFNPMAGLISLYRWCLLGAQFPGYGYMMGIGLFMIVFWFGFRAFVKAQRDVVDYI